MQRATKAKESGFTIIEVLVALAIMISLLTVGLFVGYDVAKSYRVSSERDMLLTLLRSARSQSMNNINQTRHGVHVSNNPLQYTVFECPMVNPTCASFETSYSNYSVSANYTVSFLNPDLPFDILFNQLNGDCLVTTAFNCDQIITMIDNQKEYDIIINKEGGIDEAF